MRKAKKKALIVQAYRLGDKSSVIDRMIMEGKIKLKEKGSFEVFSQEAKGNSGELAREGDYIKIDSSGNPYPNSADFFEKNHQHVEGTYYKQKSKEVSVWMYGDPQGPEIRYLTEHKQLTFHESEPERYFQAFLWGTMLSAAKDAVIIFYQIIRNETGEIQNIEFNFIERKEFDKTYELLSEK